MEHAEQSDHRMHCVDHSCECVGPGEVHVPIATSLYVESDMTSTLPMPGPTPVFNLLLVLHAPLVQCTACQGLRCNVRVVHSHAACDGERSDMVSIRALIAGNDCRHTKNHPAEHSTHADIETAL